MKVVSPEYIKPGAKNVRPPEKTLEASDDELVAPNKNVERLWRAAQIIALLAAIVSVLVYLIADD